MYYNYNNTWNTKNTSLKYHLKKSLQIWLNHSIFARHVLEYNHNVILLIINEVLKILNTENNN